MRIPTLLLAVLSACGTSPDPTEEIARPFDASLLANLPRLDGGSYDATAALRAGKSVALVFWQPWCGACRAEVPELMAARIEHRDQLEIVGIVSGPDEFVSDDKVRDTVQELDIQYVTIRDRKLELTESLRVRETPTIVILDQAGQIAYRGNDVPADWHSVLGKR